MNETLISNTELEVEALSEPDYSFCKIHGKIPLHNIMKIEFDQKIIPNFCYECYYDSLKKKYWKIDESITVVHTQDGLRENTRYWQCQNKDCGKFWEGKTRLCHTCATATKEVRLKDGKVEECNK